MNVFLTGASGYLGGHCAEAFLHHGSKVTACVRASSRVAFLESLGVTLHTAALDQTDELRRGMRGADVVVHVAAKVEPAGGWQEYLEATIDGTRHVLEAAAAAGVRQVIYISSVGVYERPAREGILFEETCAYGTPYRWRYYARAKIEAEQLVREAHAQKRLVTTILRPTWIYGPRDTTTVGRTISALRSGRVKWIGSGDNRLNLVYATDAAQAIVLAATNRRADGQIYNVADDSNSPTQRQFLTRICELLDLPSPRGSMSYRLAHNIGFLSECLTHATAFRVRFPITRLSVLFLGGRRRFSNEKIRTELAWKPSVSFEDGIHRTIEWFRTVPSRGRPD
ncbi:MAG TPA: NAD(P)-dependent oxidoreductase [Verrucomicrobiae bacterium]|nr:NAD(P)-dependent oxidoreductase [Verrucomicrobiae bacterium]